MTRLSAALGLRALIDPDELTDDIEEALIKALIKQLH